MRSPIRHLLIIIAGIVWAILCQLLRSQIGLLGLPETWLELLQATLMAFAYLPIVIDTFMGSFSGLTISLLISGVISSYILYFLMKLFFILWKKVLKLGLFLNLLILFFIVVISVPLIKSLSSESVTIQPQMTEVFSLDKGYFNSIFLEEDRIYYFATIQENAVGSTGTMGAIDLKTKTKVWEKYLDNHDKAVTEVNRYMYYLKDKQLTAVNKKTGEEVWQRASDNILIQTLTFDNSMIYLASAREITALNANNGSLIWRRPLLTNPDVYYDNYSSVKLEIADGRLFSVHMNGYLIVLDALTGKVLWEFPALDDYFNGGGTFATVAVRGDDAYLTQRDTIIVLDAENGAEKSRYTFDAGSSSPKTNPTVYQNLLLVRDYGGNLTAVDVTNGKTLWKNKIAGGDYFIEPQVVNDSVVTGDWHYPLYSDQGVDKSRIFSFDVKTGEKRWEKYLNSIIPTTAIAQDKFYLMSENKLYSMPVK